MTKQSMTNLEELTQEGLDTLTSQLETGKQARVAFEASLAELNGTSAEKDSRITELTLALSDKEAETNALKLALEESNVIASEAKQSLANAVNAYKALVVQANPAVPGELITGDTIDAINQSMEKAAAMVAQVRSSIEQEIASGKVPAGAPARSAPDLESLSPREKIQYAVTKGGKR